ncbi:IclR family transcriptional regulator [Rhodococcus sp. NPDC060176]|uniref:IclR family transcriptional regulator n=1 Tax=Rhodococcus sp. NPDC060176 TaxID=3347062 RepID=UPI0036611068
MSNNEPHDAVSKSLRALLVLATHESMGVSELSRELDVAASTAHRLLNIMRLHDFVEQNMHNRRYRLGPAARKLGETSYRDGHLVAAGRPHLDNLRNLVDETVNLVALDGTDALFLDGIQSRQHLRVATRTGARLPAYATAGGKLLLSRLPRTFVHSQFPITLDRVTRFTIADRNQLEIELEQIHAQGFAINFGEHLADVCAVAVPVLGIHEEPIAALTMAAPLSRWTRRRLAAMAPTLLAEAAAITRDLRTIDS